MADDEFENIDLSKVQPGDIQHQHLPHWFIDRVKGYKATLAEVETATLDKALNDFQRDAHPERELEIWERIANTYAIYIEANNVSDRATKKDIYAVLLQISLGNGDFEKINSLTPEKIKVLAYNYRGL